MEGHRPLAASKARGRLQEAWGWPACEQGQRGETSRKREEAEQETVSASSRLLEPTAAAMQDQQ